MNEGKRLVDSIPDRELEDIAVVVEDMFIDRPEWWTSLASDAAGLCGEQERLRHAFRLGQKSVAPLIRQIIKCRSSK